MKVMYIIKQTGALKKDKKFTYGKEYKVFADYRKRKSLQINDDNGFVVINDNDETDMLFQNEVKVIDDGEECYVFGYDEKELN